jgi:hypothetical protein
MIRTILLTLTTAIALSAAEPRLEVFVQHQNKQLIPNTPFKECVMVIVNGGAPAPQVNAYSVEVTYLAANGELFKENQIVRRPAVGSTVATFYVYGITLIKTRVKPAHVDYDEEGAVEQSY